VIVKLDFTNAFNSIHRHDMLHSVHNKFPELYAYCQSAHGQPSHPFHHNFGENNSTKYYIFNMTVGKYVDDYAFELGLISVRFSRSLDTISLCKSSLVLSFWELPA